MEIRFLDFSIYLFIFFAFQQMVGIKWGETLQFVWWGRGRRTEGLPISEALMGLSRIKSIEFWYLGFKQQILSPS